VSYKFSRQDFTGGIIDEQEQTGFFCAIFQPGMKSAADLGQLSPPWPPFSHVLFTFNRTF
jgi:hypothetical protein